MSSWAYISTIWVLGVCREYSGVGIRIGGIGLSTETRQKNQTLEGIPMRMINCLPLKYCSNHVSLLNTTQYHIHPHGNLRLGSDLNDRWIRSC